ncbi:MULTISPECIES: site-specific integrase [unclassified Hydrogenophaga]|uniref:tyrosine-type recombinase/integrase n=1 Tax=unclassified Hydrogenophaga TaxID=2610897 RepID=UPI000877FD2D|nr:MULTISPECIES: site-specific integrase [unclassified Hydrogenophaga]MBN9371561.1 integrase arm-type DNA-binding domain-containing protein [Hydrogenophaga sp.]OJV55743.1 MAG: integrase [Hydrogenophaga sp. 70-12]
MLTDAQCRNATCPPDKRRERLTDSGGLYLEVSPAGSKRWFQKLYVSGKETRMALGSYPAVTLTAARKARDAAKLKKADGFDPVQARKLDRLKQAMSEGETFEHVAREWYGKKSALWSAHHKTRELRNLEKDLFPWIGKRRIAEVEPVELLQTLRRVEARGSLDVAHRVLTTARGVFAYAVATGKAGRNVAMDLKGALTPHKGRHFAALTDPVRVGELIRAIRGYKGGLVVRAALQLAPMLFQRPTELRAAEWSEFDLDAALWTIQAKRMKRTYDGKANGDPHLVPLPTQAVAILRELHHLTGDGVLLFPGEKGRSIPISDNTLRAALLTLGYGPDVQTVHGFRATARTLLDEVLEFDPLVIEAQLAHAVKDANGRAYNRTTYLKQRADMMQRWADYLDKLAAGADVIQLNRAA